VNIRIPRLSRKSVIVVSLHLATIRRDIIPLNQYQIPADIRGQLVLVLISPPNILGGRAVGADRVVGIEGGHWTAFAGGEFFRDEGKRVCVEAGLVGNAARLDGASFEFKVSLVMGRQHHAQIHHRPRLPTSLRIRSERSSSGILGEVVIIRCDNTTRRFRSTDVGTLGFAFGKGIGVRDGPPYSVFVGDKVATAG